MGLAVTAKVDEIRDAEMKALKIYPHDIYLDWLYTLSLGSTQQGPERKTQACERFFNAAFRQALHGLDRAARHSSNAGNKVPPAAQKVLRRWQKAVFTSMLPSPGTVARFWKKPRTIWQPIGKDVSWGY
jgi:hypothetical protein